MKRLLPYLVLAAGVLAVSGGSIFAKLADAPSLTKALWRCAIACALFSIPALLRHGRELRSLQRRDWLTGGLAGLLLAGHFGFWLASLDHTTVSVSVVLVATTPVWVALASVLFRIERVGPVAWLGIGLALAGSVLISWRGAGGSGVGAALALVGSWCIAAYFLVGRGLRGKLPVVPFVAVTYGSAALALLVVALASGTAVVGFSAETVGWLLALALVSQGVGHTSLNYALGWLSPAVISVAVLAEPVMATLLAWRFLGEPLSGNLAMGGVTVLLGVALVALTMRGDDAKNKKVAQT